MSTHPQTMFQLTGRSHAPASLKSATLVVIDAQEEYRSGVLQLPGLDEALAEIAALLAAARAQGTPVVHIKHLGIPGGVLDRADPSDFGLNMAHLNACREAEAAACRVIERLAPNRAEPYLMLGVAEWALNEWQAHDTDPTTT